MRFLRRLADPRAVVIVVLVGLATAGLVMHMKRPAEKPVRPPIQEVTRVSIDELPALADEIIHAKGLKKAADRTLERLSRMDDRKIISWAGGNLTVADMKAATREFIDLLNQDSSAETFRKELARRFQIYRVTGCGSEARPAPHPVLVTGYFQPELRASHEKTKAFTYPLYGLPDDLLRIDLKLFDPALPDRRLWARVAGRNVVPYYSRQEIDGGGIQIKAPVLAWLASPVDGLMLHIQGSGLLRFGNDDTRYIHFAASNGRPYGSLAKWLIKKGWLRPEDADWPGIRAWAERHPKKFRQALKANPRYIFFQWEKDGPVGSLGTILVPMRSAAMDPAVFPPGVIGLLNIPGEPAAGAEQWSFTGFVLNQDRGSAIKGPCRVDLYCGEGEEAGKLAGRLRHRGDLYIFLKKQAQHLRF